MIEGADDEPPTPAATVTPDEIDDAPGRPSGPEMPESGHADRAGPPRPRRPRRTFNMLQILLGLGIVALLSALAIPAWFARPSVTLERAAVLLAEDLREAQNRAAFGHRLVEVRLLPEGDGYVVSDELGRPLEARVGSGAYIRDYSRDAVFRGVQIEALEGVPEGRIQYDRLGFLGEPARLQLRYGGERIGVKLEGCTGWIEIEGASKPWVDDGE